MLVNIILLKSLHTCLTAALYRLIPVPLFHTLLAKQDINIFVLYIVCCIQQSKLESAAKMEIGTDDKCTEIYLKFNNFPNNKKSIMEIKWNFHNIYLSFLYQGKREKRKMKNNIYYITVLLNAEENK